jgi:arylsulfate sulfotransferase
LGVLLCIFATYKIQHRLAYNELITRIKHIPPFIYKITARDTSNHGYYLLSPYLINHWRQGRLLVMDSVGNIVYQKHLNTAAYCFRQWKINGHIRYTYIINDHVVYHINCIKLAAGNAVIADSALREIKKVHLKPFKDITITKNEDLDLHDFILLSDNHYITMSVYQKQIKNCPSTVASNPRKFLAVPILQEISNDSVIWQWDATDFPEFLASSVEGNNFTDTAATADYLHINAMEIDPKDSNLIVSFRNNNQLIKLSRKNGQIIWRLGGVNTDFPLTEAQHFLRQHAPIFINDNHSLLFLDNGDSATRQQSRILEFTLDERDKKVIAFNAYTIPEIYSRYMGNVQQFADNYLIGGGSSNYVLSFNPRNGVRQFELQGNLAIYRVYKTNDITGLPLSENR